MGMMQLTFIPHLTHTGTWRCLIEGVRIHTDYRGRGIGTRVFEWAIERARQRVGEDLARGNRKTPLVGAIDDIARKVVGQSGRSGWGRGDEEPPNVERKLAIKSHDGTVLVEVDDIDWVDAAGDYMCVHVSGETHILRSTLKNLMQRLDPDQFKRIHRSTVVNLERIVKVTPLKKGEYLLDLGNEEQLKVSRNFRDAIKVFLDDNLA